jgi:hypothetical protein
VFAGTSSRNSPCLDRYLSAYIWMLFSPSRVVLTCGDIYACTHNVLFFKIYVLNIGKQYNARDTEQFAEDLLVTLSPACYIHEY